MTSNPTTAALRQALAKVEEASDLLSAAHGLIHEKSSLEMVAASAIEQATERVDMAALALKEELANHG